MRRFREEDLKIKIANKNHRNKLNIKTEGFDAYPTRNNFVL